MITNVTMRWKKIGFGLSTGLQDGKLQFERSFCYEGFSFKNVSRDKCNPI